MLKEMLKGQKELAAELKENTAGQKEIIRLLKEGALAGAPRAAAVVPPPAAAVGDGGNRDVRIEALGDEVERLREEVEALKAGAGDVRR